MAISTNPSCVSLMNMAKRELGAFLRVVTDLYGSEEGRIAAENWLEEFEATQTLPGSTDRQWRRITIAAAARLANRLSDKTSSNRYPEASERGVVRARFEVPTVS